MAQRSKTIEVTAQRAGRVARAVGVLGAAIALPFAALPVTAAAQSAGDGMIMIPGNGEPGVAPAGAMSSRAGAGAANIGGNAPAYSANGSNGSITQGQSPADAARAEAQFQAATRGAQIVIPGNADGGAKPAGVTIQTVRGPGAAAIASHPNNGFSTTPSAVEPAGNPAVAAMLAKRAIAGNATNEPSVPAGADLARLQQQAAGELTRDGVSNGASQGNGSRAVTTGAAAGATSNTASSTASNANTGSNKIAGPGASQSPSAGGPAANGLKFSQAVSVPLAHSMPGPEKITPGKDLGSAMSPAAHFAASAKVGSTGAQRAAVDAQNAGGTNPAPGADANRADNAAGTTAAVGTAGDARPVGPAVQPVTVMSSSGPPIEHSVTIEHSESAIAVPALPGKQDPAVLMKTAEDFLRQQANGLPGRITITVPPVNPHGLAACTNLEPFMAPGAPLWGRTTVGVRCIGDKPWTLYVLARISVQATYYVAARQIMPGDVIQASDLLPRDGDLAVMPRAIVTDPSQAVGGVAQNRLTPGLPVRTDLIRSASAIQLGQTVKVVAEGNGFSISAGGSAMNNANAGQQVRVKMENGETVVGTASGKGVVQIPM